MMLNRTAIGFAVVVTLIAGAAAPSLAQVTILADWELASDFDADQMGPPDPGGWYPVHPTGSGIATLSQGAVGVTSGTNSLQIDQLGNEQGGGTTHFDRPAAVFWSAATPQFAALQNAGANPQFFTIEFDVTFDVPNLPTFQSSPFIGVGLYANSNTTAFTDACFESTCAGMSVINPDDFAGQVVQGTVSVPFADTALDDTADSFYTLGFSFNGNWTTGETGTVYIDQLRLVEFNPAAEIDFDNDGDGDVFDFDIFMANHLVASPAFGDFDNDGDNDFLDFAEFERLYDLANGPNAFSNMLIGIPEPSTALLAVAGVLGLVAAGRRRVANGALLVLVAAAISVPATTARAQIGTELLIDSWESPDDLGEWEVTTFFQPFADPSIAISTTGATDGSQSLAITQAEDTAAVSLNARAQWGPGTPEFAALEQALELGRDFFDVVLDVTYVGASLPDVSDIDITLSLGSSSGGNQIDGLAAASFPFSGTPTELRLPLSTYTDLGEVQANGVSQYSATLGFGGTQGLDPFTVFFDNFRLEQTGEPDLLTLEIDLDNNGAAKIINESSNPIDFSYYTIRSGSSELTVTDWLANNLDAQNIDAVDGPDPGSVAGDTPSEGWATAPGSSASELAEARLLDETVLAPAGELTLGEVFNPSGEQSDLTFEFRRPDRPISLQDGIVRFIGTPPVGIPGDFDSDGDVDVDDFGVFVNSFQLSPQGGPPFATGDFDEDGDVDVDDFGVFVNSFQNFPPPAVAVPEPTCLAMLLVTGAGATACRRRMP